MDFALSETQQLLSDSATDFFSRQVDAARLREMAQGHQYDAALWRALAGQGWLGLGFESGIASNLAEQALVAEAAGYAA
ncbi:MAG: acyl-CoA dehydrogenase family protein, partial [Dehalococcoidia bacterium]